MAFFLEVHLMMVRTRAWLLSGAVLTACLAAPTCWAGLWFPGSYQTAGGYGTDWTPGNAPGLNDLGGGLYDLSLTGLAPNSQYQAKIVDDEGTPPPEWGNPEVPAGAPNVWFITDASGNVTLNVDRNTYSDGFSPATNRVTFSTDAALSTIYATGDWMNEAGGASDWVNNDPMFALTNQGGGLWSKNVVISTAGTYQYKSTANGWANQWGTNGHNIDAAALSFTTTGPNQAVTLLLDVGKGAISANVVPEPATVILSCLGGLAAFAACRRR
jgi:hypothetical protein